MESTEVLHSTELVLDRYRLGRRLVATPAGRMVLDRLIGELAA